MSEEIDSIFDITLPERPYPGLRPFDKHEWPIFFGRERMVGEVIDRLIEQRLLVVHGDSGCGKSSLIRAGVLPRLEQEGARGGAAWRTAVAEPGDAPLRLLAEGLAGLLDADAPANRATQVRRLLNFGRDAPEAVAGLLRRDETDHICVLIDQFEELFAFSRRHGMEEAQLYTQFLMAVLQKHPPGLYVVVTMRSEFLGVCAQFRGFAEAVNQTQYLLPRMAHADLVRSIREPAFLYGGDVTPNLANKLIADTGGHQDQLPLIQHGLMLLHRGSLGESIQGDTPPWRLDIGDYDDRNGLDGLLSEHADEVVREVRHDAHLADDPQPLIAKVFRALTDIDADGNAIRRRQTLAQLAVVAGVDQATLDGQILQAFRRDGVSFLRPYGVSPLEADDLVDISHEALIRCWKRISDPEFGWLAEEFRDGLIWKSLRIQADAFMRDEHNVLSPATTAERTEWIQARNPSWAERYGGHWAQVSRLIEASAKVAEYARRREQELLLAEERAKHQALERAAAERLAAAEMGKRKRTLAGLVGAVLLAVLAIGLGSMAWNQRNDAEEAREQAEMAREKAVTERTEAETARQEAEMQSRKAEIALQELQEEIRRREMTQTQAAQTVAKTTSLEDILSEINASDDPYTLAILAQSLAKQTDQLERGQLEDVLRALAEAAYKATDEGQISAVVQALNAVTPMVPPDLVTETVEPLLALAVRSVEYSEFRGLTEFIAPLIESLSAASAHAIFFRLGALVDEDLSQADKAKLQVLFDMLAAQAEFPAPRLYIHIAREDQRALAERLATQLEGLRVLGGTLDVPGVQRVEGFRGPSALRCFRKQECRVDAPDIKLVLDDRLRSPRIRIEDFSRRYEHAEDIRPRHYELWIGPGDFALKEASDALLSNPELRMDRTVGPGSRSADVERIQEWLNLRGFKVTIDGEYGKSTKSAVQVFQSKHRLKRTGVVDPETFAALTRPMQNALSAIEPKGRTLGELVVAYAKQHLTQNPAEVGGEIAGPWVRLYCKGKDGKTRPWEACFVSFILNQAAHSLRIDPPIKGSAEVNALAAQAKAARIFVDASVVSAGGYKLQPGDVYLRRRTSEDWTHTGIVTDVNEGYSGKQREIVFTAIEGNSNVDGGREAMQVAVQKRSNAHGNYDFICVRGPEARQRCPSTRSLRDHSE